MYASVPDSRHVTAAFSLTGDRLMAVLRRPAPHHRPMNAEARRVCALRAPDPFAMDMDLGWRARHAGGLTDGGLGMAVPSAC